MGVRRGEAPRYSDRRASVRTDEELMAAARTGSRDAFEGLFERYRDPVWRFFRRRVGEPDRAADLAQETFVALMQGTSRYEPRGSFRAYLFGIAYNVLFSDQRNVVRRVADPLDGSEVSPAADPETALWVRQALAALESDEREILMLREYEQLSYLEIAELRSLSLNTVKSRLFRARMALKAALEARATAGMGHENR
jgi:RNA polymerase sigma factor (sigma-70 family)